MSNSTLKVGDKIPDFELFNQYSEKIKISGKDGVKRIIYFYPKDETTVCTKQACSFSNWYREFPNLKIDVFGISSDSVQSHLNFSNKYNLQFNLLSDENGHVRKKFGALGLLNLMPSRITFIVNEKGIIVFKYEALFQSDKHVLKVKEFLNK